MEWRSKGPGGGGGGEEGRTGEGREERFKVGKQMRMKHDATPGKIGNG